MQGLGYRPDAPDERDFRLGFDDLSPLPPSVSLRSHLPLVFDQGATNSCVANALVSGILVNLAFRGERTEVLSRLYLYWLSRKQHNEESLDLGTYVRTAIKAVRKLGVCSEAQWPFQIHNVNRRPSWQAIQGGHDFRGVKGYYRCFSLHSMKAALSRGLPVVAGWRVHENLQGDGTSLIREWEGRELGGHAMLVIGYDDEKRAILVANSWGSHWRDGGCAWLGYGIAEKFFDAWAIDCESRS